MAILGEFQSNKGSNKGTNYLRKVNSRGLSMNKEYHGIHTNNDFRDCFLKLASG